MALTTTHSKWSLILALCLTVFTLSSLAEKVTYQGNWNSPGISLQKQNAQGVTIGFSIKEFDIDTRSFNGEMMQELELDGNFLPNGEGAPNLPVISRYIAVPQGAQAVVEIKRQRTESIENVNLAPSPRIPLDTERGPLQYNKDLSIYSQNAYYPQQPVILSQPSKLRGVDVVLVSITPYQYNPVTKELVVIRDMEVNVNFVGGNGHFGEDRLRSRFWDPILKDNIFNSESLQPIDYSARMAYQTKNRETGCEYLIIVPNDAIFSQWADTIKKFRTEQGILTEVVTLEEIGGNTTTAIENYINNAYNTWSIPPAAFLMMADHGTNAATQIPAPIWDNYCVSDNIYADVDNDDLPEIAHARMTAQTAAHLKTMVEKFIGYETNPPTSADFYNHPITALGWQTERWFQICSEVVGGFWKYGLGKDPVRINAVYQGNPAVDPWSTATNTNTVLNYFGPNGCGYIPATPQELGGFDGGTPQQVNDALNAGSFMLQHRDHGYEQGWGEPGYNSSSISGLTNVGKLSYIMSVNCLTGKYNYSSEVFAEKFHRYTYNNQYAGAVGILAASETSYSFVNDAFVWGMYDNMWPNFLPSYGVLFEERDVTPSFGMCAGKIFLQQSSWPYNTSNKEVTYHLFHCHGDAFLNVFTEVPQQLTVNHNAVMLSGLSTFDVTANEGAFIALTANGQIIGTGYGTGNPVAIPVNTPPIGTTVKIVVTKQNYYRHTSSVLVISPQNPYVITSDVSVNDPAGNNNQKLDFGETSFLSLSQENLGNTDSENTNVTISLSDPYITILDNTEIYGTIAAHSTVTVPNGFQVQIADNVPDGYTANVQSIATNGVDTWTSNFLLTCFAPVLTASNIDIDDSQSGNNNGRLDPGETADIIIPNGNTGGAAAVNAIGTLLSSSGWITVNSSSYYIGTIAPLSTPMSIFNVTVHPNAPAGLHIALNYTVTAGAYSAQRTYDVQAGAIVEDWETGDFTKFSWIAGGNQPWTITNVAPYEGTYSAKSGTINNSQTSQLILNLTVPADDTVSFYYKTSSEATKDKLRFYIDIIEKGQYSGTNSWTQAKFPLTAGSHTLKWIYSKDASGSSGSDCAWVDFIVLPSTPTTACMAGNDGYSCQGEPYQCQGEAVNYNTLAWESSGSGTFNDATILNPIYTPSAGDITDGSVTLTFAATGVTGTSVDNMVLTFVEPATANAGANSNTCEGTAYTHTGASATNYNMIEWTTSGTGVFENSHVINPVYAPSAADADAGSVILTLNAVNLGCGNASSSFTLTVNKIPAPEITGPLTTCQASSNVVYSTPLVQNNTYNWTVTGGEITSGANTNEVSVKWTEAGTGIISVNETNPESCSSSISWSVSVNPAPQPEISGSFELCAGESATYTTPAVTGNSYTWDAGGATISSGQNTNEIQVLFDIAGTYNLSVTETIDATQCNKTEITTIAVNVLPGDPSAPTGPDRADLYYVSTTDVTVETVAFTDEYVWKLTPAEAGTIANTGNDATVTWNSSYRGTAEVSVKTTNNCGESNWSPVKSIEVLNSTGIIEPGKTLGLSVTPNPNDGKFNLIVSTPGIVTFGYRIVSANGSTVIETHGLLSNGRYTEQLDTHLAPGVYSIIVNTTSGQAVERFVVK
jgi:hypothetical protein